MGRDLRWQCGRCGTLIDNEETRVCPTCDGINFYPLADAVPGDSSGTLQFEGDLDEALKQLTAEDTTEG